MRSRVAVARSLSGAVLQFVAYGLGMSLLVIAVVVSTVLLKGYLSEGLERLLPYVHRVAALFLIGAGAYLVYRWWQFGALF